MIHHDDIKNLEIEWRLREDIIEKDYIIGWMLWGIGSEPGLQNEWIFKGGTSIRKCYVETYRFSEDLDFTILPGGLIAVRDLLPVIKNMLSRIYEESGIDFSIVEPRIRHREEFSYTEGRIYYRGPRNSRNPGSIKLDLNAAEKIVHPPVFRAITHHYPDLLPSPAHIRCYEFEEIFAEKIRAMGERGRPRDLYDIINLYQHRDLNSRPELIRLTLQEKCRAKNIPVPTWETIEKSSFLAELESEWDNMLAHQLQDLPDFKHYWAELPRFFLWINGENAGETAVDLPHS